MEAVAFAQTREAGPRTRWFIATGTAAASRCIKVNTQPPAGPNPACSQPSPLPPTLAATASSLPPLPPPRPVPRPGVDSEGPRRGAGGVGCACGRKCVWPGLSCDSALTLSSVIWPPPAPGAVGPETFSGGGWRKVGAGPSDREQGAGRAPLGRVTVTVGVGFGTWRPLPLRARSLLPQCVWGLPVAWNQAPNATRCSGAGRGRGQRGRLAALDSGGGRRCYTPSFLAETAAAAVDGELPAVKTAKGRRRRRAAAGVAWLSCPALLDEAVQWPRQATSSALVTEEKRRWWCCQ